MGKYQVTNMFSNCFLMVKSMDPVCYSRWEYTLDVISVYTHTHIYIVNHTQGQFRVAKAPTAMDSVRKVKKET